MHVKSLRTNHGLCVSLSPPPCLRARLQVDNWGRGKDVNFQQMWIEEHMKDSQQIGKVRTREGGARPRC